MKKLFITLLVICYLPIANAATIGDVEPPHRTNFPCPDLSAGFVVGDYVTDSNEGWFVSSMYNKDGSYWSGWDYIESGSKITFDNKTIYQGLVNVDNSYCHYKVTHKNKAYIVDVSNWNGFDCKPGADNASLDCREEL